MNENLCKNIISDLKANGTVFSINSGFLTTISYDYRIRMPECVDLLSRWRIENPSLSPQRFPVSNERTQKWLNCSILDNDFRVMFMIQNHDKKCIGHIGLSQFNFSDGIVRIDSVMRGVKDDSPGIIGEAIEYLKSWCKNVLDAKCIDLLVLDDNYKAISLYEKCGFHNSRIIPLRRIDENGEINWIEDFTVRDPEKCYVNMVCHL